MTLEQEVRYWKEKYRLELAQFNSLREVYNREFRKYDHPEIRLLMAKLYDRAVAARMEKDNGNQMGTT